MNSSLPPESVKTPLEYPRGEPSDTGLISVKLISAGRSLIGCRPDRECRSAVNRISVGRREGSRPPRREISFPQRQDHEQLNRRGGYLANHQLRLRPTSAIASRRFGTTRHSAARLRASVSVAARARNRRILLPPLRAQLAPLHLHDEVL